MPELLGAAQLIGGAAVAPETILTLDSGDLGRRAAVGPSLALPAVGLPVAAWSVVGGRGGGEDADAITHGQVFAAERRADGTYAAPNRLSAPGTIATSAAAGATTTSAVVAWATGSSPRCGLQYAVRRGAGTFTPARPLASGRSDDGPTLASSAHAVVAIWTTARPGGLRGISLTSVR